MKRITLAMLVLLTGGLVFTMAGAQEPPTPPTPRAAPQPRPPREPRIPLDLWDRFDLPYAPLARIESEEAREAARAAAAEAREASRIDAQQAREAAREATRMASEESRAAMADARESARMARELARPFAMDAPLAAIEPMAPMAPLGPIGAIGGIGPRGWISDGFRVHLPPEPWAQGDPADSLYRVARETLNRGDYGRAARLFSEISQKFPKSAYSNDSPYWEALARYKVGTTDELRAAAKVLEPLLSRDGVGAGLGAGSGTAAPAESRYPYSVRYVQRRGASDMDVAALYQRINGALAQRGDRDAADKISKWAAQAGTAPCDQEDIQVRTEALNALSQMDASAALPALRRVLERKDDCSAPLRRNAVFILGRRGDTAAAPLLIAVAKSDPNVSVRTQAIDFLPRLPGDAGLSALEDLLRTDQDERIQRAVVRSLMQSDNPRARSSMRALIERKDAPLALRVEAVNALYSDRATIDDAAYLRNLYPKAENDRLKEAIIGAVSRMGGAENDQWVLAIARNPNESSQLRSSALMHFARSNTVSIGDLGKLYDSADSYNMRSQIISFLANRREPEATDRLIDIIKTGTDYRLRSQAINAITRKNDPRATKLLMDIIDKSPSDEKKP